MDITSAMRCGVGLLGMCVAFSSTTRAGIQDTGKRTQEGNLHALADEDAVSSPKLQDRENAITVARGILGGQKAGRQPVDAELTVLGKDDTPFLSDQIVGRPLWKVTVPDWSPKLQSSPPGAGEPVGRTLDILLDPIDGKLLGIETRSAENDPRSFRSFNAEEEERDLLGSGDQRYHGFPVNPPSLSFSDALEALERGGAEPLGAKQIAAVWVVWSGGSVGPKPMWVITLRSVVPSPFTFPEPEAAAASQFRYIVDPDLNKLIRWGSISAPPRPSGRDDG